jgi:hypothetical protein
MSENDAQTFYQRNFGLPIDSGNKSNNTSNQKQGPKYPHLGESDANNPMVRPPSPPLSPRSVFSLNLPPKSSSSRQQSLPIPSMRADGVTTIPTSRLNRPDRDNSKVSDNSFNTHTNIMNNSEDSNHEFDTTRDTLEKSTKSTESTSVTKSTQSEIEAILFVPSEINWMLRGPSQNNSAVVSEKVLDSGQHKYIHAIDTLTLPPSSLKYKESKNKKGKYAPPPPQQQQHLMIFGDFIWQSGYAGAFAFEIELPAAVNTIRTQCLSEMQSLLMANQKQQRRRQQRNNNKQSKKSNDDDDGGDNSSKAQVHGEGRLWLLIHRNDYENSVNNGSLDPSVKEENRMIQDKIQSSFDSDPSSHHIQIDKKQWVFYAQFINFQESMTALYFDQITQKNTQYRDALFRVVYRVLY